MAAKPQPIPEGYHTITPYITVENTAALSEFLKKAFDATEVFVMKDETGMPAHAEYRIGTSMLMIGRAHDQWKPTQSMIYLYVPDVDATFQKAVEAGAKPVQEVKDQFYGDRSGGVQDASGNQWWIATHVEDVSPEEMKRRHEEFVKKSAA